MEMQGEEVGEKDDLQDYSHGISLHHASLFWKLTITLAGPAANFLLAVFIYTIIFVVGSEELSPVSEGRNRVAPCLRKVRDRPFCWKRWMGRKSLVGKMRCFYLETGLERAV